MIHLNDPYCILSQIAASTEGLLAVGPSEPASEEGEEGKIKAMAPECDQGVVCTSKICRLRRLRCRQLRPTLGPLSLIASASFERLVLSLMP
jgi:hypothetical protein